MAINPQTGSDIEMEDDGDYTVTFSMTLPQPGAEDGEPPTRIPLDQV